MHFVSTLVQISRCGACLVLYHQDSIRCLDRCQADSLLAQLPPEHLLVCPPVRINEANIELAGLNIYKLGCAPLPSLLIDACSAASSILACTTTDLVERMPKALKQSLWLAAWTPGGSSPHAICQPTAERCIRMCAVQNQTKTIVCCAAEQADGGKVSAAVPPGMQPSVALACAEMAQGDMLSCMWTSCPAHLSTLLSLQVMPTDQRPRCC